MSESARGFVHLHCHTDYSLLDGCARIDRYMQRCRELNMPALAMTDHGNLFGAMNFYREATRAGIKPLIGCEIYLVYDHAQSERPKRDRQRSDDINDVPEEALGPKDFPRHQIHHKTLIAKNFKGYQNLVKLVSDAHLNGFYYRPRADMETLARYSEGVIALSGCINGVAPQHLIYNDPEGAREATRRFVEIFGRENYFIELQNHGMPAQERIIPGLLKLAQEFDLRVVCANDVHYVYKEDWEAHDALLCIQTGKTIADTERMKYPNHEFYLKSREEMELTFGDIPGALDNTLELAEMVDLEIHFGQNHYPVFQRPEEGGLTSDTATFDRILDIYVREKNKVNAQRGEAPVTLGPEERAKFAHNGCYLLELCKRGVLERYGVAYDATVARIEAGELPSDNAARRVVEQLDYELAIIVGAGFVDYFLITWDFIDWARRHGIPVGPGRGSGAGCLVAYALKITDIDPLRFGLLFERMLSLERVSPPDFDVDFCMRRRDEVVEYVRDKYGADKVANIITYGKFGAKMVVRDLARVMDVPFAEANRVAKMVPDDLNISLEDAFKKSRELNAEKESNEVVAAIYQQGQVIEGMVRNTGKHACGIIIGDQPLTELVPVTIQEGDLTTQYAKGPVEDLGMLKADFLGLKTLTVIADAQDHVRRTRGLPDFDIEAVPLDDQRTFDLLNSGRTTGVFQLESDGMQRLCRQIGLSQFEEIIALIALYRPGPMQFIPQYIEGKRDRSKIQIPHPLLKELVEETYGVLVYQEQVMKAAQIIAGYTLGEADILRRAMGKKIRELMEKQKAIFVEGAKKTNNLDRRTAEDIFGILEKFAEYGFNKSHSAAYAMLSYRTAYLKANYPVEFMAAVLGCELGNADKVAHFIEECSAMNVPVLGPDINHSRETFTPVTEDGTAAIRFGLGAIKGVGDAAAQVIIAERERHGNFESFQDFLVRIDTRSVNRRVIENLIRTGSFDSLGEGRWEASENLDAALSEAQSLQRDAEQGQGNLFDHFDIPAPSSNGRNGRHGSSGKAGSGTDADRKHRNEILKWEKELLGFYVSGHPMNAFRGVAELVDTFAGEDYLKLENRAPFRLCAVITGIAKKISRRDNRPWAVIHVATHSHNYTVNAFADAYEQSRTSIEEGSIVMIEGQVLQRSDDEVQLSASRIALLEPALPSIIREITFVAEVRDNTESFFKFLRTTLEPQMGNTAVRLGFLVSPDQILLSDIAASLKWSFDTDAFRALRSHTAVIDARIETAPVEIPKRAWER